MNDGRDYSLQLQGIAAQNATKEIQDERKDKKNKIQEIAAHYPQEIKKLQQVNVLWLQRQLGSRKKSIAGRKEELVDRFYSIMVDEIRNGGDVEIRRGVQENDGGEHSSDHREAVAEEPQCK